MAAGGEGDGEKSAFRCLDAARYVAAALVVVLIAAVIVNAIRVVLRPDKITLSVVGNLVSVTPGRNEEDGAPLLKFELTLRAENPSGRVRLYYYDIMAYVFANDSMATTPTPEDNCTTLFSADAVDNITVVPMGFVDSIVSQPIENKSNYIDSPFFNDLYGQGQGGRVGGVTMRVDGQLVSEISLGRNTSAQNMTLYCRDLVFGAADKVAINSDQGTPTPCSTS